MFLSCVKKLKDRFELGPVLWKCFLGQIITTIIGCFALYFSTDGRVFFAYSFILAALFICILFFISSSSYAWISCVHIATDFIILQSGMCVVVVGIAGIYVPLFPYMQFIGIGFFIIGTMCIDVYYYSLLRKSLWDFRLKY